MFHARDVRMVFGLAAFSFAISAWASSVSLDEIVKRSKEKGCQSIPYAEERKECIAIQDRIEQCKDALHSNPDAEKKRKEKAFEEISKRWREIDGVKRTRAADEKKLKSKPAALAVVLKGHDDKISDLMKEIARLTTEQTNHERDLNLPARVELADRCYNYRAGMRELFDRVITMLNSGKGFPSDSSSKAVAKDAGEKIVGQMRSEERNHRTQEDGWRNRAEGWREVIALSPKD